MANPLYYIEISGQWRSMKPPDWQIYVEEMVAHLKHRALRPTFEDFGKEVYGRPSRVKIGEGPGGKTIYWAHEKHLHIRSPKGWKLQDWEYEMRDVSKHCRVDDVPQGPDIFSLVSRN